MAMKRSPHPSASDFDELERAFFDAAPPEVPVAPGEALRFDDLDEGAGARPAVRTPRRSRGPRPQRAGKRPAPVTQRLPRVTEPLRSAGRLLRPVLQRIGLVAARLRPLAQRLGPAARQLSPAARRLGRAAMTGWTAARRACASATVRTARDVGTRARAWALPHFDRARRALVHGVPAASATLARRTRATLARLADELPGERLDGKTLAATIALVVFVVISAGVVLQRPAISAPRLPATDTSER
jgi:hypothetical protein